MPRIRALCHLPAVFIVGESPRQRKQSPNVYMRCAFSLLRWKRAKHRTHGISAHCVNEFAVSEIHHFDPSHDPLGFDFHEIAFAFQNKRGGYRFVVAYAASSEGLTGLDGIHCALALMVLPTRVKIGSNVVRAGIGFLFLSGTNSFHLFAALFRTLSAPACSHAFALVCPCEVTDSFWNFFWHRSFCG